MEVGSEKRAIFGETHPILREPQPIPIPSLSLSEIFKLHARLDVCSFELSSAGKLPTHWKFDTGSSKLDKSCWLFTFYLLIKLLCFFYKNSETAQSALVCRSHMTERKFPFHRTMWPSRIVNFSSKTARNMVWCW